jgi:hypothetical protein
MKFLITVMICFGALYLLQGSTFEYQAYAQQNIEAGMNSSDLTYTSPLYGIKFNYPSGAEIVEDPNKIYVTIPDIANDPNYYSPLPPKVIIETNVEVQPNMSLDSWTRQLISLSIHRADPEPMAFKIISINKTKISDGSVDV